MKKIKSIVVLLATIMLITPAFSQSYINKATTNSTVSQMIEQNNSMTTAKFWDLGTLDGQDKYKVNLMAVEVGDNKTSEVYRGVKVTVFDDNKKTDAQLSSLFYFDKLVTYIDDSEFEEIINSINFMINSMNTWKNEKLDAGDLYYKTNDYFVFGFSQDGKKQTGYMKIRFDRVEFSAEFKKPDKELADLKEYFEIASKQLYIDANMEKFKQSKKEEDDLQKEAEKAKKAKEKQKKSDTDKVDDDDQL